jgi:hypothetical protein
LKIPLQVLPAGSFYSVVLRPDRAAVLEVDDAHFRLKSSCLLPTNPGDDPLNPTPGGGLETIAAALLYGDSHPTKKILVTGHCDTSGSDVYNVELSQHRARVVLAALVGDRDSFGIEADGPHLATKEKKMDVQYKDRVQVLDWVSAYFGWPTSLAQNNNDYFAAVRALQRSWNDNGKAGNTLAPDLDTDADFGPGTWSAVCDCYQFTIAQMLDWSLDELGQRQQALADDGGRWLSAQKATGCGEYKPIDSPGINGRRSQANRRVEILFFDPGEEPSAPCLTGQCDPAGCDLYGGQYQWIPLPVDPRRGTLTLGWTKQTIDAVGLTLQLELSGPTIPTQTLGAMQGWLDGDVVRFTFDTFDRLAACTLRARAGSTEVTLWANQIVLPTHYPPSESTLHDLMAYVAPPADAPPSNTPGDDPGDQPEVQL